MLKKSHKFPSEKRISFKAKLVHIFMKLRLSLTNSFLANLFKISASVVSSIVNTLIKSIAINLKPLIFGPRKVPLYN